MVEYKLKNNRTIERSELINTKWNFNAKSDFDKIAQEKCDFMTNFSRSMDLKWTSFCYDINGLVINESGCMDIFQKLKKLDFDDYFELKQENQILGVNE